MNCDKCIHIVVCERATEGKALKEEVATIEKSVLFTVEVKCAFYREIVATPRGC